MNSGVAKNCGKCGRDVLAESLWGLCARCLYTESFNEPAVPAPEMRRFFGKYELQEVLGRGGMGVVYKAIQVNPRRTVALKMILDAEVASPISLHRFAFEAEVAAKLEHPNIVPIYEVGEEDAQPFLSMKFIAGETLVKKISNGEYSLSSGAVRGNRTDIKSRSELIVRLMAAIARAVHYAHQNGVLHRDLKPGNILVDGRGEPHLTDFGLAKMLEPEKAESIRPPVTVPGTAIGTPSYMSPEQAAGRRLTVASDVYSLGAIFYEMLTGEPPFKGPTPLETLRLVAEQPPRHPRLVNPNLQKDLGTICLKCLEKNPAARYESGEALAQDLERWSRQEPVHARPAGPGLRIGRWIKRNPVGTALIASLCTGLAVTLLLLQRTNERQRRLDLHRANNIQRMSDDLQEMWKDRDQRFVPIPSTTLSELIGLPPRPPDPLTLRILFGQTINHEPFGQAQQYAAFLTAAAEKAGTALRRPVVIDLRLYKSEPDAARDTIRGRLDLQKMGAVQYVISKMANPGLKLVARERSQKEAVIFAAKGSGITNLAQLAGKRVAFGSESSDLTFWAKVYLRRAGMRAADLASCVHLSGTKKDEDDDPARARSGADRDPDIQAHKQVIQEVFSGRADVGVSPRRHFELQRYRHRGLVEIHHYPVNADVYVARPSLDDQIIHALQESLASFRSAKEKDMLAHLSESIRIEGFEPIAESDLEDIRSALVKEIAEFEKSSGSSP
jgi:serine/threonine protein kinase/ABC-type phosphate/phosphonate transport system substrate-binding protein